MSIYYQEGRYLCQGIGQGFNETSNGNTQFLLNFKVLAMATADGEFQDVPKQYDRTMYQVINEKTYSFAIENLRNLGFTGASFTLLEPSTPNFHDFAGQEFEMWCSHSTYNGKDSEKWGVAKGDREFKIEKPLENKKLRALDNLFGKHLKAAAPTQKAAPTARQNGRTATAVQEPPPADFGGVNDDDVPF